MNEILSQFHYSWRLFTCVPLPAFMRGSDAGFDNAPPELSRSLIPLVGTLLALFVTVPVFVIYLVFGKTAAGITGGLAAPLALEFMTGWKGTLALAAYIIRRRAGATQDEAFELDPPSLTAQLPAVAVITIIVIWLMEAALFAALSVSGALFWIIVSMTASYIVRAELASVGSRGDILIESPEKYRYMHFYLGGAVMLIVSIGSIGSLACACLAFGAAWGSAKYASALVDFSSSRMNLNILNIFGRAVETAILLLGVFFLAGTWR